MLAHIGTCIFMSRVPKRARAGVYENPVAAEGGSICVPTSSLTIIFVLLFQVSPLCAYFKPMMVPYA